MNKKLFFIIISVWFCCKCYPASKESQISEIDSNTIYTQLLDKSGAIDKVFFAPRDAATIENILIGLIRSTQTEISGALFRLSNKRIIEELIVAHQRNVKINIILDPEALSTSQVISKLSHAGIVLSLYNNKTYGTYMHHKFLIFRDTLACQQNNFVPVPQVISFGSLNITEKGLSNNENITFRDKPEIVQAFVNEIEELKKKTDSYELIPNTTTPSSSIIRKPTLLPPSVIAAGIRSFSTFLKFIK